MYAIIIIVRIRVHAEPGVLILPFRGIPRNYGGYHDWPQTIQSCDFVLKYSDRECEAYASKYFYVKCQYCPAICMYSTCSGNVDPDLSSYSTNSSSITVTNKQ